jgi:hypothetical protein
LASVTCRSASFSCRSRSASSRRSRSFSRSNRSRASGLPSGPCLRNTQQTVRRSVQYVQPPEQLPKTTGLLRRICGSVTNDSEGLLFVVLLEGDTRMTRVGAVRNRLRFCKDLWARSWRPQVWQLPHARSRT